jgi:hypothetical protein
MIDVIHMQNTAHTSDQFAAIFGQLREHVEAVQMLLHDLDDLGSGSWLDTCKDDIHMLLSDLNAAADNAGGISDTLFEAVSAIRGKIHDNQG